MNDSELIDRLRQLSKGLLWMSESDYPFETIYWKNQGNLTKKKLLQLSGHDLNTLVEVEQLDRFFVLAIKEQDWHEQEKKAEVKRYRVLLDFLKNYLRDIKVYRVGEVEIDIYIVGRTNSRNLAGLYFILY